MSRRFRVVSCSKMVPIVPKHITEGLPTFFGRCFDNCLILAGGRGGETTASSVSGYGQVLQAVRAGGVVARALNAIRRQGSGDVVRLDNSIVVISRSDNCFIRTLRMRKGKQLLTLFHERYRLVVAHCC